MAASTRPSPPPPAWPLVYAPPLALILACAPPPPSAELQPPFVARLLLASDVTHFALPIPCLTELILPTYESLLAGSYAAPQSPYIYSLVFDLEFQDYLA